MKTSLVFSRTAAQESALDGHAPHTITCSIRGSADAVVSRSGLPIVSCIYTGPDRTLATGMYRTDDGAFEFDCMPTPADDPSRPSGTCNLRRTQVLPADRHARFRDGMLLLTDCANVCAEMFPSTSPAIASYVDKEHRHANPMVREGLVSADPWLRDATAAGSMSSRGAQSSAPICMRPFLVRPVRVPILVPGSV